MRGPKDETHAGRADEEAMGFPSGVPGIPDSIFLPENFVFPVFDYDWGPDTTTTTRPAFRPTRRRRSGT